MADDNEQFRARITATDDSAPILARARTNLDDLARSAEMAGQKLEHVHDHTARFGQLSEHVSIVRERFGGLHESITEVGSGLSEVIPVMAAFTAAHGMEELAELAERTAESYGELAHQAQMLGTNTTSLHDLHTMAALTDTNVEALDKGLAKLNVTLGDVAQGKGNKAAEVFESLNLDPAKFHNSVDALTSVSDAFSHVTDATLRASYANTLFGKGGKEMIPILAHGGAWMRDKLEDAHSHNFDPNEDQGEHLERYNESMKALKASVQAFHDETGTKLATAMQPAIDGMDKWVQANRDWLSTTITSDVSMLGETLTSIPWKKIGDDLEPIVSDIDDIVDSTVGWKNVLEGMALYWARGKLISVFGEPIRKASELGEGLVALGAKVGGLAGKWDTVASSAAHAAAAEADAERVAAGGAILAASPGRGEASLAERAGAVPIREAESAAARISLAGVAGATIKTIGLIPRALGRALLGPELITGYMVHEADSEDNIGQWIDRRVPGAAAIDDWSARHFGVGRHLPSSPALQPSVQPSGFDGLGGGMDDLGLPFVSSPAAPAFPSPPRSPSPGGAGASAPRVDGEVRVTVNIVGAPPGSTTDTQIVGGNLATPRVNVGLAWPLDR